MYLVGELDYKIKTLSSWIKLCTSIQIHFNSIQSLQEKIYILSVQDYTTILGLSCRYVFSESNTKVWPSNLLHVLLTMGKKLSAHS